MPNIHLRERLNRLYIANRRRTSYLEDKAGETFLTVLLESEHTENIEESLNDEKDRMRSNEF